MLKKNKTNTIIHKVKLVGTQILYSGGGGETIPNVIGLDEEQQVIEDGKEVPWDMVCDDKLRWIVYTTPSEIIQRGMRVHKQVGSQQGLERLEIGEVEARVSLAMTDDCDKKVLVEQKGMIAVSNDEGSIILMSTNGLDVLYTFEYVHEGVVTGIDMLGDFLISCGVDNRVCLMNVRRKEVLYRWNIELVQEKQNCKFVCFSDDCANAFVVYTGRLSQTCLVKLEDVLGKEDCIIHEPIVLSVAEQSSISVDRSRSVLCTARRGISVYDLHTGVKVARSGNLRMDPILSTDIQVNDNNFLVGSGSIGKYYSIVRLKKIRSQWPIIIIVSILLLILAIMWKIC